MRSSRHGLYDPLRHLCSETELVIDLAYVLGTLAFFALMLAYVAGCARLGRDR